MIIAGSLRALPCSLVNANTQSERRLIQAQGTGQDKPFGDKKSLHSHQFANHGAVFSPWGLAYLFEDDKTQK
ncbi:MAG: hypothetical protein AAB329_00790 [Pseudomonadota bacterium]